jgi:HSP20 family protein
VGTRSQRNLNPEDKMMTLIRPELGLSGNFERWLRDSFWNEDPFRAFWGFDHPGSDWRLGTRAYIAADLYEDTDAFYTVMELPGVCKKDIDLELVNSVLQISGKHTSKTGESESTYEFSRAVAVPEGADGTRISAELKDGLLLVTMPKMEERKTRAIEIK